MSFLNPFALAWLGLSVPVIALYFLKLKRRKVSVPSTWLWSRSVEDLRVNAPFQRLRKNLLLLLQLLLIAAASLALTQPIGRAAPPEAKRWAILIDASASMQMKDAAPSRLERAKEAALAVVAECGPDDEVMVVAFSNHAQLMTPLTGDRSAAKRAIAEVQASDSTTRVQEAYRIAASAIMEAKQREIVVVSDGGFEAIEGAVEGLKLRFVPIGGRPRNAAITALDVRRPARTDEPWVVFAQIDNFGDEEREIPAELYVNGQLKAVKKITIPPDTGAPALFEVSKPEPDVVQVRLDLADDLDVDNSAWCVVRHDRARILLAGVDNFFLERALSGVRDAESFRVSELASASLGAYDLAVLHGAVPDALPEGRYLIFGGVPKWEGIQAGAPVERPPVLDWDRRHPVARGIDFSGISIKESPRLTLSGFAAPIVESSEFPLIFAWERGRTKAVVVPFSILDSNWPLRLSFPLFVMNALNWLRESSRVVQQPGEPLRLRLGENEREVEVAGPDGKREKLGGEPGRDVVYGATQRCGLYTVTRGAESRPVALNLLDPAESRGMPAKELKLSTGKVTASTASAPVRPYWRWFALAVALLLIGEWFVYHRRVEL